MELTRRGVIRLAGAAGLAAAAGAVVSVASASPALADQGSWRWCRFCQGLWFSGNPTLGVCPARGTAGHSSAGSGNYSLPSGDDSFHGQLWWIWCSRCQGLWFSGNDTRGVCPAGPGGHEFVGSGVYALNVDNGDGQANWRWCQNCQGLWFAANGTGGVCPGRPAGHVFPPGSGNYHIGIGRG